MNFFEYNTKIKVYEFEEYPKQKKDLINKAKKSVLQAYAPYSHYCVGAAVLLEDGTIITGNNQENAAYPSGLCAERTAIFYANAQHPQIPVSEIVIAAYTNGDFTKQPCSPCGACRQVMTELESRFKKQVKVTMYGKDKIYEIESIKQLLPLIWDADQL